MKITFLIAAIPVLLVLAYLIGDVLPMLVFFAVGAFAVFAAHSAAPGTPAAWVRGHLLIVAIGAACAVKMLRGDKRGVTGTWQAFRRREKP